jgi:hypothetical protein
MSGRAIKLPQEALLRPATKRRRARRVYSFFILRFFAVSVLVYLPAIYM